MGLLVFSLAISAIVSCASASEETPEDEKASDDNFNAAILLAASWAGIITVFTCYQISIAWIRYKRRSACLRDQSQSTLERRNPVYGWLKTQIFDAPLFRTRHHREFKLSTLNMGYLPSRLQALLLLAYTTLNVILALLFIDLGSDSAFELLRDRTGVLCVVNLLLLILVAGRNNPLIYITGVSFDSYNYAHRGVGRVAIGHAIGHFVLYLMNEVETYGWKYVWDSVSHDPFYLWGTIFNEAFACFILISFQAWSPVRHAFYEIFIHFHVFLSALGIAGILVHCVTKDLYQIFLVQIALGIWGAERLIRLIRIGLRNFGGTEADVQAIPGQCLRINIEVARPWKFKTGQHVYLYVPRIGWWTSHPFSLAWIQESENAEKSLNPQIFRRRGDKSVSMSLLVRRRAGFTDALYRKAEAAPGKRIAVSALVEGPYGYQNLSSYGSVMLVAAGVGIAHQMLHVRFLVEAYKERTAAVRRVSLIWITQSEEHLEWINPWITEISASPECSSLLETKVFVTRGSSNFRSVSGIQIRPGKPQIETLIQNELENCIGACAVSVCGTGSLADEVRSAVRARQVHWNVDFLEESFSW